MMNEDWEYEAQKDSIYLLEEQMLLEESLRQEALIYTSEFKNPEENANQQVAKVLTIAPEGLQPGPNVPAEPNSEQQ